MSDSGRPRILLIKPILPYPPNQGTRIVSFGLIKALKADFDVTVLARVLSRGEEADARELAGWCSEVVTVLAPNRRSLLHRVFYKLYYYLKSVVLRRSLKGLYDCPGALVKKARELAKRDFDLVIVEYWQLASLARWFSPEKSVLLTHDIDLLVNQRESLLERNLFKKIQTVRRWLLEQREELAGYRAFKFVWALTERDRQAVQRVCGDRCRVEVLPVGVDIDHFAPSGMQRNPGEVLFMGFLQASFNLDALRYFVESIYPHLDGIEGQSITVVGGSLPDELEHFALNPEVEVVGRVGDVRPYLHRASCLVLPLRFGGGLRIRILEAMAAEVPIVCTSVAIAGMPFEAGTEYLLAESPEDFAAAVRRIAEKPEFAARMAQAARKRVEERYSLAHQMDATVRLVHSRVGGGGP